MIKWRSSWSAKPKNALPTFQAAVSIKVSTPLSNQTKLGEILDEVALPRKGKRSKKIQELESSEDFQRAHDKHSAVESAINALEVHGLDRCPDHGLAGFKRYVALSVVARNIQRIGAILTEKERGAS